MNKIEIKEVELLSNYEDVLTVKDVREILKIGRNYCYNLLQSGCIPSIRVGNSYRIPKVNIINYLNNLK